MLDILNDEVRAKIAAADKVLKEARDRRDLAAESAMEVDGAVALVPLGQRGSRHGQ